MPSEDALAATVVNRLKLRRGRCRSPNFRQPEPFAAQSVVHHLPVHRMPVIFPIPLSHFHNIPFDNRGNIGESNPREAASRTSQHDVRPTTQGHRKPFDHSYRATANPFPRVTLR